jgi:hypothetical protein
MGASKKPRKPYKPKNALLNQVRNQVADMLLRRSRAFIVVGLPNREESEGIWLKDLANFEKVKVVNFVLDCDHPRTVLCAKILRNEKGIEYMEAEQLTTSPCKLEDIDQFVNEVMAGITHNKNHLIGDAWLMFTGKYDVDTGAAGGIFDRLGAWKGQAQWEKRNANAVRAA